MKISLRNRLSYRQAKTAVLAGLVIGFILSAIQIGYDYTQEVKAVDTNVSDVIDMFRDSAVQASYTVDESLAESVVSGLFEFQPVFDAKVIDEFGEVLGQKHRPLKGGKLEWLVRLIFGREKSYIVPLFSPESQKHLGRIELSIDNYLVASAFIRRSVFVIMSGLLRNICLAFIFLSIFYYTLTRPILETVKEISSVDPSSPGLKMVGLPKGHEKDEIGLLVEMTNQLVERFEGNLARRRAAEEELRKHHDRLEELVKERTAELEKTNEQLLGEIDERRLIERALEEERDRAQTYLDLSPVMFVAISTDGEVILINKKGCEILGYDEEGILGKNWFENFLPERLREEMIPVSKKLLSGEIEAAEYFENPILTSSGHERLIAWHNSVLTDDGGDIIGHLSSGEDISDRRLAEEQIKASLIEKEVLLREIHHRVKNNMQVITSLLKLQSDTIKDKQYADMLRESQERIKSMALIHEKLYRSKDLARVDFKEYIKSLINGLFRSHGIDAGRITTKLKIEDVSLGLDHAIPCGLIINELVSNSLKYAFPQGREGEISVALFLINGDEVGLTVRDDGIGMPEELDFRSTKTLGLDLVRTLVEHQLEGQLELDRKGGTGFNIRFAGET
ncbi:MAG: PAS domain S-box protein [Nitrospina sp.]|nr:PAS domain S-box protein [Nitrospina sp.]